MSLKALRRRGAPIAILSLAAFAATLFPARPAVAQTTSDSTDVTPPAHGVGGSATLGQAPPAAGSGDALISADPSTGAARASLAFQLPRARGDAQPSLGLSYNSFAGMGAAGLGWSLDVPSIERKNASGFPRFIDGPPGPPGSDPTKDPDDFVFAGEPLVPVCVVGAAGSCPGVLDALPFPGYTYYRTERDNFARFFLSADHTQWIVQSESGVLMYFGSANGDASALEMHDASVSSDANTLIYRWNLSYLRDEAGNNVVYRWASVAPLDGDQPTSATGPGLKYLTDVYDTPSVLVSRTAIPLSDYAHHTHLFWRGSDSTILPLSPGWKSIPARVIGDVAVASQTFTATAERALVRLYHLSYSTPTQHEQRFLQSFELHACTQSQAESNGNIADPATWAYTGTSTTAMPCPMTNPTSLYYTQLPAFAPTVLRTFDVSKPLITGVISTGMLDVTGDGVADLVAASYGHNVNQLQNAFAMLVADGTNGSQLVNQPFQGQVTGPFWAQLTDFLPSSHTTVGNWIGDGQLNWLWFDGVPQFNDPGPVDIAGPLGTTETYTFSPGASGMPGGFVPVSPQPKGATTSSPYPTPCPAPFGCSPAPNSTIAFQEEWALLNWQRAKGFDVNGDGLQDMALVQQVALQNQSQATVQATYFTHQGKDGTIVPYLRRVSDTVPAGYNVNNFHAVADMDADGLADIIELTKTGPANGFDDINIVWWKNRGDGRFGLGQAGGFSYGPMLVTGGNDATNQTVDPTKSNIAIGDVTGDGLADVLALRGGTLYVYVQPPRAAFSSSGPSAGFILAGSIPNAAVDDNAVVSIADIDGSGTSGVAISEVAKITLYKLYLSVPKPGLLQAIQNEHQARTQVQYQSVAQLSSAATTPWQTKLPAPTQVVVDVSTSGKSPDGTGATYETKYAYTDPMYDARDRQFVGFRVVEEDRPGSVAGAPQLNTVTTFIPATCPGVAPGVRCATGIDYGWRIRRGLPASVQLIDAASQTLLSTTTTQWSYLETEPGADGRKARMVYARQVDMYDGEPSASPVSGAAGGALVSASAETDTPDTTWQWSGTTTIPGSSVDRRVTHSRDAHGDEVTTIAWGAIGLDTPIVTQRAWQLAPGDPTSLLYRTTQTLVAYGDATGVLQAGARETDYQYDAYGRLSLVQAPLTGTQELVRANPGTGAAPRPPGQSSNTAAGAPLTLASYSYDAYGNVTTVQGPDGRCSGASYDTIFNELPVAVSAYRGGCGNSPLTTGMTWDRGLQKITQQVDAGSALTAWTYDSYGRLKEIDQPSAATLGTTGSAAVHIDWSNMDQGNVAGYSVRVTTQARDSFLFFDTLGRQRFRLDRAEAVGSWIVSGGAQLAPNGRVQKAYVPFLWWETPALYTGLPSIPITVNNYASYTYDALGRPVVVTGPDGVVTASLAYHPLKTDVMDGEQAAATGPHKGSYTETVSDGRGTPTSTTRYLVNDPVDQITTTVTHQATGEVTKVQQTHTAGPETYTRSMTYDSLGRLVLNTEPNTSTTNAPILQAWRYAYDDAGDLVGTSDARGCGENLVYDALGRLVNEDYSPCTTAQAVYTAGYETFFTYDVPVLTAGTQGDYAGKLTSSGDRATNAQIAYDARGRPTTVRRQLAVPPVPGNPDADFSVRYAPNWFERDFVYDDANRVQSATTGVDMAAFGLTAAPSITNHYTLRGTIDSIDGSYGALLKSAALNPDGSVHQQVFGDVANTTVDFDYWTNGLLKSVHAYRPAGPWTTAPGYVPPTTAVPSTLEDDLENLLITYDKAGNPWAFSDQSSAQWPSGAHPASRNISYDDNYRMRTISTFYNNPGGGGGTDSFSFPPYAPEVAAGKDTFPATVAATNRVQQQGYAYDWQGNMTLSSDDQNIFLDRSLGKITNGAYGAGPHQLTSAALGGGSAGATYDPAGNLVTLIVTQGGQTEYDYSWDELGSLASAVRSVITRMGKYTQTKELIGESYTNDSSGRRILKAVVSDQGKYKPTYYADVFDSLRLEGAAFPDANGDYQRTTQTESVMLVSAGMRLGRALYSETDPLSGAAGTQHIFLELGDHLGSTSFVIDQATSELVERQTYQGYGAAESDFRTARWSNFRETFRHTGHEDDAEVGLVYFGHRYYSPLLSRWISPDPLAIHGLGGDLNPYAFVRGSPLALVDPSGLDGCDSLSQSCPSTPPCTECSYQDTNDQSGGSGGGGGGGASGSSGPSVAATGYNGMPGYNGGSTGQPSKYGSTGGGSPAASPPPSHPWEAKPSAPTQAPTQGGSVSAGGEAPTECDGQSSCSIAVHESDRLIDAFLRDPVGNFWKMAAYGFERTGGVGMGGMVGPLGVAEGAFTPLYDGYPAGALQPTGAVRLLSGEEYTAAREAADAANDAAHAADPGLKGLQVHEIKPVKFGGDPTNLSNKIALTQAEHSTISTWWFRLQRYVEGMNGK